jgi:dTMP kinase
MKWVSIEGPNGVGKSYLLAKARELLHGAVILDELPASRTDQLTCRLTDALGADPFLRTGFPLTETFTLLGLAVRRYEQARAAGAELVVEDRGVDTIAIYQTVITAGGDDLSLALKLLETAALWRPSAQVTVLVLDEPQQCLDRWRARVGHPIHPEQRALMEAAARLYERLAIHDPHRYALIDRRQLNEQQAVEAIVRACLSKEEPQ